MINVGLASLAMLYLLFTLFCFTTYFVLFFAPTRFRTMDTSFIERQNPGLELAVIKTSLTKR
jgi:hypothetical protein